jgi:hypothetical protein
MPATRQRQIKMSTALALTVESTAAAIAAAAQEENANEVGKLLKFSKGHFLAGTEEIPAGTKFVAHAELWVRGWVKFKGGQLVDRRVGRVADGFVVPEREALGDNDSSTWETDTHGDPQDPWSAQSYLPMETEDGEILTFVSGSVGGRQAVSRLCARAARQMATKGLPIISLGIESYKHPNYGRIDKPDFQIIAWTNPTPKPEVVQLVAKKNHDEFSDDVPF